MEATMLNTLEFRVTAPTVYVFLNRYLKVAHADTRISQLATFIVERQLQEYKMLAHAPSKLAAAAVNIALRTLRGRAAWADGNGALDFYTGYTQADLRNVITDIQDVMNASITSSLQAVRKKHSAPKYGEVANIALARLE
jgi:Cyclin, C-terminal domain